MTRRTIARSLAAALGLLALNGAAQADEIGETLYNTYCSACHGTVVPGGGPSETSLATLLNVEVPALTHIAARNDGVFPLLEVIHIIDGRTGMRAHGGPMPVWGDVFRAELEPTMGIYGSAIETRGRTLSLALYIESIQQ